MAYFDPKRPIVVQAEASFHEGLFAGLFQIQATPKGLQPVHFISRTMTDAEKRYSQTKKDTLSIQWAKNGHYNLVAVDKQTRYPETRTTYSTAFKPTKEKPREMFATHGTPRQLESDNGPPFNSKEFAEFAEEGFHHHQVTPEHARANGEAESFMKLMNRSEQISHLQGKKTIQDMLTGYRSTPHHATNVTPYEALMNRPVRTKLDHQVRNNSPKTKTCIRRN